MWKVDEEKCIGCGACVSVCPVNILELVDREGGKKASIGDKQKECIVCKACENTCPVQAIKVE